MPTRDQTYHALQQIESRGFGDDLPDEAVLVHLKELGFITITQGGAIYQMGDHLKDGTAPDEADLTAEVHRHLKQSDS